MCSGCGSESISCGWLSLLTKVTWLPTLTTMLRGLTALPLMVMVVVLVGVVAGVVGVVVVVESVAVGIKAAEMQGDLHRALGYSHSKHLTYRDEVPAALRASIEKAMRIVLAG